MGHHFVHVDEETTRCADCDVRPSGSAGRDPCIVDAPFIVYARDGAARFYLTSPGGDLSMSRDHAYQFEELADARSGRDEIQAADTSATYLIHPAQE